MVSSKIVNMNEVFLTLRELSSYLFIHARLVGSFIHKTFNFVTFVCFITNCPIGFVARGASNVFTHKSDRKYGEVQYFEKPDEVQIK